MAYYTEEKHDKYKKGEAFIIDKDYGKPIKPLVCLPHQCSEWVIGGKEELEILIADLKVLLDTFPNT